MFLPMMFGALFMLGSLGSLSLGVVIERMKTKTDQFLLVSSQRRHPVGIVAIDLPREFEELFPLGARLDWFDG